MLISVPQTQLHIRKQPKPSLTWLLSHMYPSSLWTLWGHCKSRKVHHELEAVLCDLTVFSVVYRECYLARVSSASFRDVTVIHSLSTHHASLLILTRIREKKKASDKHVNQLSYGWFLMHAAQPYRLRSLKMLWVIRNMTHFLFLSPHQHKLRLSESFKFQKFW